MRAGITEVIQHRNLIRQLVIRDLKLRYERSVLGFFWSLLNPLIMIGVYTFFFSHVVRLGIDRFSVFLVAVLLPWNFVSRCMLSIAPLVYQNGYLLNRAAFPAESLILGGLLSSFVEFCLEMLILTVVLIVVGAPLFPGLLALPVAMAVLLVFSAGLALLFAVAYVYYRDTQYILGILTTVWFYMSPVFYPVSSVPERFQAVYKLNPMVHIAGVFRDALYVGRLPDVIHLGLVTAIATGCFALGWAFFNRHKHEFAEIL